MEDARAICVDGHHIANQLQLATPIFLQDKAMCFFTMFSLKKEEYSQEAHNLSLSVVAISSHFDEVCSS